MKKENKKATSSLIWLFLVAIIAVGLLLFCQFFFGNPLSTESTYYKNTYINGIDVSGLTQTEAENLISTKMLEQKKDIKLNLSSNEQTWTIKGDDLEIVGNYTPTLEKTMAYSHKGNIFTKKQRKRKIKKKGLYINIPFEDMYGGIENKINNVISSIETTSTPAISFTPESSTMFAITGENKQIVVDREKLKTQLDQALSTQDEQSIEVPIQIISPEHNLDDFINKITMRSRFSTDFSKSTADRKTNIGIALSKFNGMIVEPQQEVSFNAITGPRTSENGYKSAKIIVGGKYVAGMGGGVCQASTTLYNALLLADIEVLSVYHHTLPASYVPLSFDAMVSEGYADLVFKNNLDTPIFIKAYTTSNEAIVEVYGQPHAEAIEIKTRAELIKILPHGGDDIITDNTGEYEDKVLYRGEYYRLKFPQEGYESKGYIQYIKNGEVINEKQIRHDKYLPQNGIIVEGNYVIEEGMTIPNNSVRYIPPQKTTPAQLEQAKTRWKTT